jgi:hypothetical protein
MSSTTTLVDDKTTLQQMLRLKSGKDQLLAVFTQDHGEGTPRRSPIRRCQHEAKVTLKSSQADP